MQSAFVRGTENEFNHKPQIVFFINWDAGHKKFMTDKNLLVRGKIKQVNVCWAASNTHRENTNGSSRHRYDTRTRAWIHCEPWRLCQGRAAQCVWRASVHRHLIKSVKAVRGRSYRAEHLCLFLPCDPQANQYFVFSRYSISFDLCFG